MKIRKAGRFRNRIKLAFVAAPAALAMCVGCSAVHQPETSAGRSPDITPSPYDTTPVAPDNEDEVEPETERASPPRIKTVIVVSVDGLGSELIGFVGASRTPTLAFLQERGLSTLNARTAVERTVTLPNHAGMLTGRPIAVAAGGHGVTINFESSLTVSTLAKRHIPSVFDRIRHSGGSTALYATERKFGLFERSWPDAIDRFEAIQDGDAAIMHSAMNDVRSGAPAFTFIHLGQVDEAGHRRGWLSAEQQDAVVRVDALLGNLVQAIKADPELRRRTLLIVTADHGGVGRSHTDNSDPRNFTVPFLLWGAAVERGGDVYDLNQQLVDPGVSQPGYDEATPMRNGCVANVALGALELGPLKGSTLCRAPLILHR